MIEPRASSQFLRHDSVVVPDDNNINNNNNNNHQHHHSRNSSISSVRLLLSGGIVPPIPVTPANNNQSSLPSLQTTLLPETRNNNGDVSSSSLFHVSSFCVLFPDLEYELLEDNGDHAVAEETTTTTAAGDWQQWHDRGHNGHSLNTTARRLYETPNNNANKEQTRTLKLYLSFFFLILCGAGNAVLAKLQTLPMYNYPNFLNLYANFLYIPICFAYILPAIRYGSSITVEQRALPRRPFIIMGCLDGLAATLQTFASVYLPGPLLVLLPQACIPVSIVLSKSLLGERYTYMNYLGALVVLLGVILVMEPVVTLRHSPAYYCEALDPDLDCTICQVEEDLVGCLSHSLSNRNDGFGTPPEIINTNYSSSYHYDPATLSDSSSVIAASTVRPSNMDNNWSPFEEPLCQWLPLEEASRDQEFLVAVWSLLLLFSTIPMTLSTLYKKRALDDVYYSGSAGNSSSSSGMDPIYLNGWVSIYRFLFILLVTVPAALWLQDVSPTSTTSSLLTVSDVWNNLWDGWMCFSASQGTIQTGCHPDTMCESFQAAIYVNLCLICYVFYSISMLLVLKYSSPLKSSPSSAASREANITGGAAAATTTVGGPNHHSSSSSCITSSSFSSDGTLLFLALTIMVPVGQLAFSLPFLPNPAFLHRSDLESLVVVVVGLTLYRLSDRSHFNYDVNQSDDTGHHHYNNNNNHHHHHNHAEDEREHLLLEDASSDTDNNPEEEDECDEDESRAIPVRGGLGEPSLSTGLLNFVQDDVYVMTQLRQPLLLSGDV